MEQPTQRRRAERDAVGSSFVRCRSGCRLGTASLSVSASGCAEHKVYLQRSTLTPASSRCRPYVLTDMAIEHAGERWTRAMVLLAMWRCHRSLQGLVLTSSLALKQLNDSMGGTEQA